MLKGKELIYERIERYITGLITRGKLKQGDRLLSESQIGKLFKTSNITVRKGMRSLLDQGVLEKIQGKGTFVRRLPSQSAVTNKIGVLHCHDQGAFFQSPFYAAIMAGIELESHPSRKLPVICPLFDYATGPKINPAWHGLMEEADGLILVDLFPYLEPMVKKIMAQAHKPLVIVNYEGDLGAADTVVTDSEADAKKMTEFLLGLGHRKIGFVYLENNRQLHPNMAHRLAGYRAALAEHGLPADERLVRNFYREAPLPFTPDPAVHLALPEPLPEWHDRQFRELVSGPDRVSAVFCPGDHIAAFLYRLARRSGCRIPEDLTIVGYDDIRDSLNLAPPLTTLHTPLIDMGCLAVKRLLEKSREKQQGIVTYTKQSLPGTIIERGSHQRIIPDHRHPAA